MIELGTIRPLLEYGDWANGRLVEASGGLTDEQLDRAMEIGPGSMRRVLLHVWAGEDVWLKRWMGKIETPWPDEKEKVAMAGIAERLERTRSERERFVSGLESGALSRKQSYRDSKGGLFAATLGDMMVQGCVHS